MAAGATYEPIATTTLGTASATITFSSIPATYTDLKLVLNGITTGAGAVPIYRFNGITTTTYSTTWLAGDGTSATSGRTTNQTSQSLLQSGGTSSTLPFFISIDVLSYAGSTNKTSLYTTSNDLNGSGQVERGVGLWRDTSAITSISIVVGGTTFKIGTTATLYGILKA